MPALYSEVPGVWGYSDKYIGLKNNAARLLGASEMQLHAQLESETRGASGLKFLSSNENSDPTTVILHEAMLRTILLEMRPSRLVPNPIPISLADHGNGRTLIAY